MSAPLIRYFDHFPLPVLLIDLDGGVLGANIAACRLLDWAKHGVGRKLMGDIVAPDARGELQKALGLLADGRASEGEIRIRGPAGTEMILEYRAGPVQWEGEAFSLWIAQEVTERKRIDAVVKEEREILHGIYDHINFGISLIDESMRIYYLNRKMREWFPRINVDEHPVCYQAFNDPPRREVCSYCPTIRAFEDGRIHTAITNTPTPEGFRKYEVRAVPIKDERGIVFRVVELVDDVTEKLRFEEELRNMERIDSIGALATSFAHDFNNIMVGIHGYADLALHKYERGMDIRDVVERIKKESEIASSIAAKLLAFGSSEELELKQMNLNDKLEELMPLLKRVSGEGVKLGFWFDHNLPAVDLDANALERIMVNLVFNAKEAMPEGGKLSVSTHRVEVSDAFVSKHPWSRPGTYALLRVSDSGEGIPPEIQSKVFDPFFSTKAKGKGTGLGLSIVYGLVKQMGGFINLESKEGRGTTFKLYFPCSDTRQREEEPGPAEAEPT